MAITYILRRQRPACCCVLCCCCGTLIEICLLVYTSTAACSCLIVPPPTIDVSQVRLTQLSKAATIFASTLKARIHKYAAAALPLPDKQLLDGSSRTAVYLLMRDFVDLLASTALPYHSAMLPSASLHTAQCCILLYLCHFNAHIVPWAASSAARPATLLTSQPTDLLTSQNTDQANYSAKCTVGASTMCVCRATLNVLVQGKSGCPIHHDGRPALLLSPHAAYQDGE